MFNENTKDFTLYPENCNNNCEHDSVESCSPLTFDHEKCSQGTFYHLKKLSKILNKEVHLKPTILQGKKEKSQRQYQGVQ